MSSVVRGVEHLRNVKTTLNDSVVVMMEELQEAQLPAQKTLMHAQVLERRVGGGDGGGDGGGGSGGGNSGGGNSSSGGGDGGSNSISGGDSVGNGLVIIRITVSCTTSLLQSRFTSNILYSSCTFRNVNFAI